MSCRGSFEADPMTARLGVRWFRLKWAPPIPTTHRTLSPSHAHVSVHALRWYPLHDVMVILLSSPHIQLSVVCSSSGVGLEPSRPFLYQ